MKYTGWCTGLEIDILRVILVIILIFFLPGFFLVQALFPRKNELDEEDDLLYRIVLGIVLSIVITTFDGFILGSLGVNPSTGKGYWDTPYIIGSLIAISAVLFVISWFRGAYPFLRPRSVDKLAINISKKDKSQFYRLMDQWKKLEKELERYNDRYSEGDIKDEEEYKKKTSEITEKMDELEAQLVVLGQKEMPIIKAKESVSSKNDKIDFDK